MLDAGEQADAEEAVKAFQGECEVLRKALVEHQAAASPMQDSR